MGLFDEVRANLNAAGGGEAVIRKQIEELNLDTILRLVPAAFAIMSPEKRIEITCDFLRASRSATVDYSAQLMLEAVKRADVDEVDHIVDKMRQLFETMEFFSNIVLLLERAIESDDDMGEHGIFTSRKNEVDKLVEDTRMHMLMRIAQREAKKRKPA